jgi:hypothetical protein
MTKRAPNLQDAGHRFRPAYLVEFLQQPDTVRRGIGSARMPDYRFSAREALALTLFLGERRQSNSETRAMPAGLGADAPAGAGDAAAELLITERYRCTACRRATPKRDSATRAPGT